MDWLSTTRQAFALLFSGDAGLWAIIFVSLKVSLLAMLIAAPAAIGIGYLLATASFRGRKLLIQLNQGLLASPTVVVGLILYLLLSRQGIFGSLHLLFTRKAMILGQIIIALPVLVAFTLSAVQGADPRVQEAISPDSPATFRLPSRWRPARESSLKASRWASCCWRSPWS